MKDEKGGQMKNELDFDELHAAVNKLMDQTQKPKAKREPAKSVAKAVTRPSVKVAERPNEKEKSASTASAKEEPKEESSNIAVRHAPRIVATPKKRGMAMDVVQAPKAATVAPPSARAARTAPTLQPTGPVKPEPPSPRAPGPNASVVSTPQPDAPPTDEVSDDILTSINLQDDGVAHPQTLVSAPQPKQESVFPDPLDVHGFTGTKEYAEPRVTEPPKTDLMPDPLEHHNATMQHGTTGHVAPLPADEVAETASENHETGSQPTTIDQPAPSLASTDATPFVNAKVEKRPLGAFANATPPAPVPKPKTEEADMPTSRQTEPAQIEVPPAPEELRPEVVAVESAESELAPSAATNAESLQNLRQMSIPPQYHTSDKEPNKDDRPVFDTKNYHIPLQPVGSAKRSTGSKASMVLTLVLILLLVVAGVGAYFIATGSIDISKLF
jgi:hypothetical protein